MTIQCLVGKAANFWMLECVMPKALSNKDFPELTMPNYQCLVIVTDGRMIFNIFCEKIGSMLNQTCPANITFEAKTIEGGYSPFVWLTVMGVVGVAAGIMYNNMRRDQERQLY